MSTFPFSAIIDLNEHSKNNTTALSFITNYLADQSASEFPDELQIKNSVYVLELIIEKQRFIELQINTVIANARGGV